MLEPKMPNSQHPGAFMPEQEGKERPEKIKIHHEATSVICLLRAGYCDCVFGPCDCVGLAHPHLSVGEMLLLAKSLRK